MRRSYYTLLLCLCAWLPLAQVWADDELSAQEATLIQYADTFKAQQTQISTSDAFLLDMLTAQSEALAARQDSLEQVAAAERALADSLRRADSIRRAFVHPLSLPLRFRADNRFSLRDTTPQNLYGDVYAIRRGARRYLNTHAAGLYVGVEDTISVVEVMGDIGIKHSTLGVGAVAPALVKDAEESRLDRIRALRIQNNPWRRELNLLLQFSQNYVSGNWYAGGNSNLAILGIVKGNLNYDAHKRVSWENTLEWRLGTSTVHGDSLRKINTTDDLFRLYSKVGVKIVNKLYGSASAEFQTTLFRTWKTNEKVLKTGPFAPLRMNLSLGVDYKPIDGLSIVVSPLAYKMVYAADTIRTPYTSFGIAQGSNLLSEVGSSVRVEWTWNPLREISLYTLFYTYTNYRMIELDLEVTCDFIINRFLSTRLTLHPRYDSSRIADGDERAKIQFKEFVSIGFAHKFR